MTDRCSAILAGGVFDTTVVQASAEVRMAWQRWWYSQDEREARHNVEAGIGLPIADFLIGGSFNEGRFESWKRTVAGTDAGTYFGSSDLRVLRSVASPAILGAYNRCVETTDQGVHIFDAVTSAASRIVVLYIKYNPAGNDGSRARVEASAMVNATLATPIRGLMPTEFIKPNTLLPFGTYPVTVRINDPAKIAVFDLYTDKGSPSHNVQLIEAVAPPRQIEIPAYSFTRSQNIEIGGLPYGDDVIHNAAPYNARPNMAEYQLSFSATAPTRYNLEIEYAADDSRPVHVSMNGVIVNAAALEATTGGWYPAHQRWGNVGIVELRPGINLLRISRDNVFPHIHKMKFTLVQ